MLSNRETKWLQTWDEIAEETRNKDYIDAPSCGWNNQDTEIAINFYIACRVLSKYSCSTSPGLFQSLAYTGGSAGRLFTGQWASHFGDAVQRALQHCGAFNANGSILLKGSDHSLLVELLARLKYEIGDNPISAGGDLDAILTIFQRKADVTYDYIPSFVPEESEELKESYWDSFTSFFSPSQPKESIEIVEKSPERKSPSPSHSYSEE